MSTRRRTVIRTAAAAAGLALLAACSGADDADDASAGATSAAPEAVFDGDAVDDLDAGADEDGDGPDAATGVAAERAARDVVRRAEIVLELDDPEDAVERITDVADDAGGFVSDTALRRDRDTGELGGSVTLRVPNAELFDVLARLEDLAQTVPSRTVTEQDVTGEVVDLRAQVTNLTAYEEQLRALLADVRDGSSDPDDLLPVFDRVQSVRSDIDRLTAQLDDLQDRVALSTVVVELGPTPGATPVTTGTFTPGRTLEAALAATGRGLGTVVEMAIWLVVTVVPVGLAVAGPPVAAVLAWRRFGPGRGVAARPGAAATTGQDGSA